MDPAGSSLWLGNFTICLKRHPFLGEFEHNSTISPPFLLQKDRVWQHLLYMKLQPTLRSLSSWEFSHTPPFEGTIWSMSHFPKIGYLIFLEDHQMFTPLFIPFPGEFFCAECCLAVKIWWGKLKEGWEGSRFLSLIHQVGSKNLINS